MKSLLVGKALLLLPLLSSQNSACLFCNNDGTRDLPGRGFERYGGLDSQQWALL